MGHHDDPRGGMSEHPNSDRRYEGLRSHSRWPWLVYGCVIVLLADLALAQRNPVEIEELSLREGPSQGTVFTILQDRLGYMWIGAADGLNRYDGFEFRHFRTDPLDSTSISDNRVIALLEDRSWRLWVGSARRRSLALQLEVGVEGSSISSQFSPSELKAREMV